LQRHLACVVGGLPHLANLQSAIRNLESTIPPGA
jgi:hypothetical protein